MKFNLCCESHECSGILPFFIWKTYQTVEVFLMRIPTKYLKYGEIPISQ